ncbi:magnesium chelatase subunit H [Limnohabitans sp. 2KL-17]|uniref:magnesium chelatase subunit H n=1 Tax=Limnohabitans sp. 2KL-17 TaxID=1100704 RepID=UPI001E329A1A|nr:magnesium chelatase subunit H [Limnohabitans sp. 2KL-17]
MSVVLLTMDSHLASAADSAAQRLAEQLPGLHLQTHSASAWRDSDSALAACLAAVAQADIVIVTMLFMEDHFLPVLDALQARRGHCDAMVCIMSAPQVTQLTHMGKLVMGRESGGLMALLKKLRPSAKNKDTGEDKGASASAGSKQMAMLRRLPKLLRFIPGTAQDLRIFFLTMRYWLAGSEHNIEQMVKTLVHRYAQGPREHLRALAQPEDPIEYPEVGLYHPQMKNRISEQLSDLPGHGRKDQPAVGLLLLRSYLLAGNTAHYDAVITSLQARGLRVIPAFASGLDSRPAMDRFFKEDSGSKIQSLVSLTGFSLVGGPAYNDASAAEVALSELDVPYIAAHPLEFQTIEQWGTSTRGLLPVENTIMVAIPELDGSILPMVYGGRPGPAGQTCNGCDKHCTFPSGPRSQDMFTCTERTEMLTSRIERLVRLRHKPRAERKLAIVLFNFPPNAGSVGTAAYLSVFQSLFNTLQRLSSEGYRVKLPDSVDDLRNRLLQGNASQYGTQANVLHAMDTAHHVKNERWLHEIEAQWGPAPGKHLTNGQSLFILGADFGQVVVTVQPGFGYEGDPMRLLFETGCAPTHAFSAFYRYLRDDYAADAVLHFGTHGALEFMPGKQTGLSAQCWPDRLIGALPNIYLYAANNPSEGALAKRRGAATLVSYLTPSLTHSGLYKELVSLQQSIERWQQMGPDQALDRTSLGELIHEQARAIDLTVPAALGDDHTPWIEQLQNQLLELEYALIPEGLHVMGQAPTRTQRLQTLKVMADAMGLSTRLDTPDFMEALVDGASQAQLSASLQDNEDKGQAESLRQLVRTNRLLGEDHEMEGLMRALDGRYLQPAPGGDLIRNADVLPTGRNLHGLDPFRMPSAFAVLDGKRQADKLLARYAQDHQDLPETVAMVLWGTDNLKTEGGPLAQALALMGAAPRFDSYGRLAGAMLVPLAELKRPRIDVVITLSGIFRDLLPMQIRLLAEAAFMAASADEPTEQNFIRKHALAFMAEHEGSDLECASLRVFGNTEGAYGANINHLIDSSCWENENELGDAFTQRKGFAYGREGRPVRNTAVLTSALASVSLTYQNLDSVELGVTSIDTYFDTLGGISRAVLQAKHQRDGNAAEAPPVFIGDQTQGEGVVRSLTEQVALETRSRMLNPKWHESMLQHGYEGVRQIEAHLTNTMGWSATTGQVQPWVYQQLAQTFVLDPAMRERMAQLNPTASAKVANRLLEATRRQYWQPDAETMSALLRAGEELEDRLEGIQEGLPA